MNVNILINKMEDHNFYFIKANEAIDKMLSNAEFVKTVTKNLILQDLLLFVLVGNKYCPIIVNEIIGEHDFLVSVIKKRKKIKLNLCTPTDFWVLKSLDDDQYLHKFFLPALEKNNSFLFKEKDLTVNIKSKNINNYLFK